MFGGNGFFIKGAEEAGHKTELVSFLKHEVKGCLGCNACRYEKPCIQKDSFNEIVPEIKLPMSFPYCAGQVPVYYNEYMTERPHMKEPGEDIRYRSKYLDIPNEPLCPFGYGLTYTEFSVSDVKLSAEEMRRNEKITVSVVVRNIGKETGTEVVQMYIRDVAASIVHSVKELKGFEKVTLYLGEEKEILFTISENELKFVLSDGNWGSESGEFRVYIGTDSTTENYRKFVLV